ncbi:MAG: hypothetical protein A2V77_12300 [Anaeromyxobacter sp. RBG_16_69_14]|nr:MAG: hypothetical protein A2V77_12300 [Anaeromyxobacter sp. RBG_16_69_14]HJW74531.1 hypothetical protein [Thermoleophilia bacterium]
MTWPSAGAAAAEAAPSHPLARHELELQAATVEVFCGDTTSARKRFDRLGPHPTIPDYLRLTEAVVDLAEGRPAQARAALEAWEQAIAKTGMATTVRVGNEWAEETERAGCHRRESIHRVGVGGATARSSSMPAWRLGKPDSWHLDPPRDYADCPVSVLERIRSEPPHDQAGTLRCRHRNFL